MERGGDLSNRRRKLAARLLETLEMRRLLSAASIPLPVIPAGTFDITTFGATIGAADNSTDIQAAISAASAQGGGTVLVPAGKFLSGPITLANNINLEINGELEMLAKATWPDASTAFITASSGMHDIEISGTGKIDGQGAGWWTSPNSTRPHEVVMSNVSTVLITGIELQNSPKEHIAIQNASTDVRIDGIEIATSGTSPNTDGMDLSGTHEIVENCKISDGDDNVAIGASHPGTTGPETADITVTNCSFGFGHGVSIGSSTDGGIRNFVVSNCTFRDTTNGIRLKTDNTSGGLVQDLTYTHLTMHGVANPILISSYYTGGGIENPSPPDSATASPVTSTTPFWKDIKIDGLVATRVPNYAAVIFGRPEAPIMDMTISNVTMSARAGFVFCFATGITFGSNCDVTTTISRPVLTFDASVIGSLQQAPLNIE